MMRNITVGTRCYPLSQQFVIQPYAGLSAMCNVGDKNGRGHMEMISDVHSYQRDYNVSCPRASLAPFVGADIYLFSSLALELQYGFALALDGKTSISTIYDNGNTVYATHSNMHRHNVQIGMKATFPFRFTSGDTNNIFDLIYMALGIYEPDEHKTEKRTVQRRRNLQNVLKSY
ncbi:hypothetical protein [Prevotella sp.]|uniref:hypothetical protein n=1 Tax=Prevotella sp. TaxID=59823 RepID=UPI0025E2F9D0|nr:hypothetical protein [Prevotella sp.]